VLVVLGKLELDGGRQPQAIMNNVPYMRPNGMWKVATKNPAWPPIPVRLVQEKGMLIKVVDPIRQRFASLDALSAQAIAPLMENSNLGVTFKVTVPSRKRKNNEREGDAISDFAILQLKILAPRSKAKAIGKFLSQKRAWLRNCPVMHSEILYNPHDPKTFATTSSVSLAVVPGSSSTAYNNRTVEEIRTDVLNMFDSIIRTEHLPEAEKPANIKTELLSHQKQALFFLTEREEDRIIPKKDGGEVFHLWKSKHAANGKTVYYNVITGTELPTRPPLMRGGILADVMGLGKTLSILSLVVASMSEARKFAMCPPPIAHNARLKTNAHSTLLICPLSVVANWEIQLKDHIKPDSVKCYIYHGPTRTKDPQELRGHDIVITSYHTVANDLKYHNSPLFQIHWFRVVLDEAHIIRNPAAGFSIAACELAAERRWAVTGTPVQNRLDDLGSLIKFLRIKPFDSKGAFAQYILAPFKTADPEILPKLRLLVDSITLRRLKENIDLPPRKDSLIRLEFTKEERELYKVFVADSKSKVQLLTSGERMGGRSYAHILKSIMRLRLICAHGEELLSDEDRKLLEGLTKDKAIDLTDDDDNDERPRLSKKQAFEMLELLRQSNLDDCPRCGKKIGNNDSTDDEEEVKGDTNTIGHMTACYHVVCPDCWPQHEEEVQQQLQDQILKLYEEGEEDPNVNTYTCPYCRQEGTKMDHEALFQTEVDAAEAEKARIRANPKLARQMGFYRGPHTKTLKLVEYLKKYEAESHSMPEEAPIKRFVISFHHLSWYTNIFSASSSPGGQPISTLYRSLSPPTTSHTRALTDL
jgi:SNF2 family DNA or RNA helicase